MATAKAVYHLEPSDPYKAGAWTYVPERAHQPLPTFAGNRQHRLPGSVSARHRG